jgi:hypothetical protein
MLPLNRSRVESIRRRLFLRGTFAFPYPIPNPKLPRLHDLGIDAAQVKLSSDG